MFLLLREDRRGSLIFYNSIFFNNFCLYFTNLFLNVSGWYSTNLDFYDSQA